jgi:class 3 adenylate cyclase
MNVAARLEGQAPPGGILISGNARDAVVNRVSAEFRDLGRLPLAFGLKSFAGVCSGSIASL